MIDINLFRKNPDAVRDALRRRFQSVEIVDEIIQLDKEWRQFQFELEQLRKDDNKLNKEVGKLINSGADDTSMIKDSKEYKDLIADKNKIKDLIENKNAEVQEARTKLDNKNAEVGNLVDKSVPVSNDEANNEVLRTWTPPEPLNHVELAEKLGIAHLKTGAMKLYNKLGKVWNLVDKYIHWVKLTFYPEKNLVDKSVPVSNDEANNEIVRTCPCGEKSTEPKLLNHVELVEKLGIADLKKGANVAGGRGYYLKGDGVLLNQALINFGLAFLGKRNYTAVQTPFFMRKDIMGKCAQLAQFDEELYKVTGEGDDKYLIATAEQPLCAYHIDDWIHPSQLPIRYSGYSSCFRKEAGSHGRDTLGIFRVHQFEKIEQFCITSPIANDDENSWKMLEEMIKNSEDFYQMLKLPYQIVAIVSGALNDAAAKKYDLEAWFPASNTYRELVSCSNCTDYQSRKLEIRYGQKKGNDQTKQYCHLLNSTLTATERTLCCILENYQTKDGVEIPEVLQPYMEGKTFISFPKSPAKKTQK